MTQIRAFGQGQHIQEVQDAYSRAMGNDGRIDRAEFGRIASELNDVWKLNRIDLMNWIGDRDPALARALKKGQAAMDANVGWANYQRND